jgi:hypothetical protein
MPAMMAPPSLPAAGIMARIDRWGSTEQALGINGDSL